jgi:hypothetical protein
MGVPNDLPAKLVALRDAAIAHAVSGSPLPKGIGKLASWFDPDDQWDHEFMAVHLTDLAQDFNDAEARGQGDFLKDDVLTDADRVEAARAMVEQSMEEGGAAQFYVGFNLASDSGDSATIWFSMQGNPLDGYSYSFKGVYADEEECKKDFRKKGILVDPRPEDVPEKAVLDLWQHK